MLVIDSSITMVWCFEDETSELAELVFDRLLVGGAYVPLVWPLEVANSIVVGERRRRLSRTESEQFLRSLARLPITIAAASGLEQAFGSALSVAREQGLSIYDACYLDLSLRLGLPLATLDGRLRAAAERVGVPVVGVGANGTIP